VTFNDRKERRAWLGSHETDWESLRNTRDVVNMIAQRHEQIEEQLAAALLHFHLHRATSFECSSTANDQSEVMSSKFRVITGSVGICVAS
jgi:hypothetical protein